MIDFLSAIWGESSVDPVLGEVRRIRNGSVERRWFRLWDLFEMMELNAFIASSDADGWDTYYGVLPRVNAGGTSSDTTDTTQVVWSDIDMKAMPSGTKQEAWVRITQMDSPPTIIVDSGHGYHAYWNLRERIDWTRAEAIMRGIADEIGGDRVYDRARILRIPGTHNHKDPTSPIPVRLLRFDRTRTVSAGALGDYRDRGLEMMAPARTPQRFINEYDDGTDRSRRDQPVPDWLRDEIEKGAEQGQRSEAAFRVILWLLRYGRSDGEIIRSFIDNPTGIGEKFWEKGGPNTRGGMHWLERTIAAARRVA